MPHSGSPASGEDRREDGPTPPASLPADLAARYRILTEYRSSEGWAGCVAGRDGGQRFTLKVLASDQDLNEASLLASLTHPNIARVEALGQCSDGRRYLLREHVEGEPLAAALPLAPDDAEVLARQLLETLAMVHLRGILHLDLKPANILRCAEDRYVVLDFGIGARNGAAARGWTPGFTAPETLLGLPPDRRCDLYSV